jgi:acyl-CoA thioester hydrolase
MGRASPDLLDPARYGFVHELQTRYSDVDPNQHINNVAMAAAFEDARVRFDWIAGVRALFQDLRVMIVAANIDYLAEAHFPQPLHIHVAVLDIGRTSWTVGQLAMQEGRPRAYCRGTVVATDGQRPTPLPQNLRDWLEKSMIKPVGG